MSQEQSDQAKQVRRRAVHLTPAGLALLEEALERGAEGQKPTRVAIANRLGLSIGTSQRVLSGKGVDRASLILAFQSLGLAWEEEYCEQVAKNKPDLPIPAGPEPSEPSPAPAGRPLWRRWVLGSLTAVTIAGFLMLRVALGNAPVPQDTWRKAFDFKLHAAISDHEKAHYGRAQSEIDEAIVLARPQQDQSFLASALLVAGDIASASGSLQVAKDRYEEALRLRRSLGEHATEPPLLEALGNTETRLSDLSTAGKHLHESLNGFRALGDQVGYAMVCRSLGIWALEKGDNREAARWLAEGLVVAQGEGKADLVADIEARGALIKRDQGQYAEARSVLEKCLAHWTSQGHPRWIATTLFQLATVECSDGRYRDAQRLLSESKRLFSELGDEAGTTECASWISKVPSGP